jgi:cytochrome c peroxidase
MFSDYNLHVLGVRDNTKLTAPDAGANGSYAFRTPSLRNLAYTAPYMHSGVLRTLDEVVNFYNTVGRGGGRGGPGRGPGLGRGPAAGGSVAFDVVQNPVPGPNQGPGGGGPGRGPGRGGRGGGNARNPNVRPDQLDPLLRRVNVRNMRPEIVAFLGALNSDFDRSTPQSVPSGLRPGGN